MDRHIGFYLGISPTLLHSHFSEVDPSAKFLASIVCDLFPSPRPPPSCPVSQSSTEKAASCPHLQPGRADEELLPPPTMPILVAVSNSPPIRTSLGYHSNLTRFLIGTELSDRLGVRSIGGFWGQVKLVRLLTSLVPIPSR